MTKLDSDLAWRQASGMIAANREIVLALVGMFCFLPHLAMELFLPVPVIAKDVPMAAAAAMLSAWLSRNLHWFLIDAVVEFAGALALLALFCDRARPTVSGAIRAGLVSVLPYFGALLLFGMTFTLVLTLGKALALMSGSAGLDAVAVGVVGGLAFYCGARLVLLPAVVTVERMRNPIAAIGRAWRLARGNVGRIMAFLLLVSLALLVVNEAVMTVAGSLVAQLAGARAGEVTGSVITSLITTGFTAYFMAILAAMHAQLAGPFSSGAFDHDF